MTNHLFDIHISLKYNLLYIPAIWKHPHPKLPKKVHFNGQSPNTEVKRRTMRTFCLKRRTKGGIAEKGGKRRKKEELDTLTEFINLITTVSRLISVRQTLRDRRGKSNTINKNPWEYQQQLYWGWDQILRRTRLKVSNKPVCSNIVYTTSKFYWFHAGFSLTFFVYFTLF